MIIGGRYQESLHPGTFSVMPLEGKSIVGYDNAKKVFVSSWIENMEQELCLWKAPGMNLPDLSHLKENQQILFQEKK
ncbi:MAG: hypothetical protein JWQ40_621 [Segetibacter sp.]|nr:hypothetical protein [Segetibacter sp.]